MGGLVKDWRTEPGKNPDDWLERAPEFSRPLCAVLREWIFRWEPDLGESIKWGSLCFTGRKLVCALGAFQKHAGLTFFRGAELPDPARLFNQGQGNAALRTIRMQTLEGLPRESLRALLHAAVAVDADPTLPRPAPVKRPPPAVPDFFSAALRAHRQAAAGFRALAPSCQREYLAWLSGAKRPETRAQRLQQTLAALAAGRQWANRRGT